MYLQFFGFTSSPFGDTPDVRQFWDAHASENIFKMLLRGLNDGEALQWVTAEPGLGKSMLCRRLLNSLRSHKSRYDVQFMPFPNLRLDYLLAAHRAADQRERNKILLIDEAQSLPTESLQALLASLQQPERRLQAVLFGQPELDTRLQSSAQKSLIKHQHALRALTEQETGNYIQARFDMAGRNGAEIMEASLIAEVYQNTGGVLRLINTLMRKALMHACEEQSPQVTTRHIRLAAATTAAVAAPAKH